MSFTPGSPVANSVNGFLNYANIYYPQFSPEFLNNKFLHTNGITDYLELFGKVLGVQGETFDHWEQVRFTNYLTAASQVSSSGAGTSVTITLSTQDHSDSGKYSEPQVNDKISVPSSSALSGYVIGRITSVNKTVDNAHTITAYPTDLNEDFGTIAANSTFIITSNAWGEGTAQPSARRPKVAEYTYTLQISKATYTVTGSEYGNKIKVTNLTDPQTGKSGPYAMVLGMEETVQRFRMMRELDLVTSNLTTNTAINDVATSTGIVPWILNNNGNVMQYNSGGWNYAKFTNMIKQFKSLLVNNSEWLMKIGVDLWKESNTWIQDTMKNGAVSYGAFNGKKELAVSLSYDSITDLGYTFHLSDYPFANDAHSLGAPGFNWPGYGIVIPVGGKTNDPQSGKMVDFLRLRVKDGNGWNRGMVFWPTGNGPTVHTNQTDSMDFNWLSHTAPEMWAPELFYFIKRV